MEQVRVRYFTPREAHEALAAAVLLAETAREALDRGHRLLREGHTEEARAAEGEARAVLEELSARGVEVKGIDPLLLDFPALRYGAEVYLCWREGEDGIEWWHPLATGINGRQSLKDTESGAWEWCN